MSTDGDMDDRPGGLREAVARKGSFLQTMGAVGWSFFGVRKSADLERDVARLNPVHVVVAALLGVALLIGLLLVVVDWVIGSGVAS